MELNAKIYLKCTNPDFIEVLSNFDKEGFDIEISSYELGVNAENLEMSFQGGSDIETDLQGILVYLMENSCHEIRAYTAGDEDPQCNLYLVDDEGLLLFEIDPGIYEHLSECDPDEIEDSEQLKEAYSEGPRAYFESQFNLWKSDLSNRNLEDVSSIVKSVIDQSESLIG